MFLAQQIGLLYAPAAGIIAILSRNTKKPRSLQESVVWFPGDRDALSFCQLLSFRLWSAGLCSFSLPIYSDGSLFQINRWDRGQFGLGDPLYDGTFFAWPLIGNAFC